MMKNESGSSALYESSHFSRKGRSIVHMCAPGLDIIAAREFARILREAAHLPFPRGYQNWQPPTSGALSLFFTLFLSLSLSLSLAISVFISTFFSLMQFFT